MSNPLQHLINNNRLWAERVEQQHPGFFKELSAQHHVHLEYYIFEPDTTDRKSGV